MAKPAIRLVGPSIASKNNLGVFGTDGIRGKVGTILTPALILQLGYWASHALPTKGPVLIGQDSRLSSDMVSSALAAGLTAAGREVWILGLCPTPAVPYLIKQIGASGGLMVSASHNPPEDNGIKIFDSNGEKLSLEKQQLIESKLKGEPIDEKLSSNQNSFGKVYQRNELLDDYKSNLIESVKGKSLADLPIVLDLCWGSAAGFGREVFEALGAKIKVLHGQPDGSKINVSCGSTQLDPLRKAVLESGAEMGFAFDGDADRMLAIDSKGRIINGDHILFLWGSTLQKRNALPENRLVATVMSNLGFERAWKKKGGRLERTAVGDQHVHAAMLSTGSALGGEQSGHILSSEHGLVGDGLLSALQMATLCHTQNLTLAEWRDQSFKAFPQKLVNVAIPSSQNIQTEWRKCEPLTEAIEKAETTMGADGRVLLRASGTEPLLRVMVEAKDPAIVHSLSTHLTKIAEQHLSAA